MKYASKDKSIKNALLCLLLIMLITACNDKEQASSTVLKPSYAAPFKVLLDTVPPPIRVDLKNVPPPHVVRVPKTTGGFNTNQSELGEIRVELKPPATTRAEVPGADFTNFNTQQGLPSNSIYSGMMDRRGQLWFSTGNKISCYDGNSFSSFMLGQGSQVYKIFEDKEGIIWFAIWGGGVFRYDGVKISMLTTRDGLAHDLVTNIMQDKSGNIWFSTNGGGVSRYDARLPARAGTDGNDSPDSYRDGQGKRFTNFNAKNGLASDFVSYMLEDRTGNIWFCTLGGISCFDGKSFKTFTEKEGLVYNGVFSVLQDRIGNLWFATEKGISRYDGKHFTTFDLGDEVITKNINDILEDNNGSIWFASVGGGVYCYNPRQAEVHNGKGGQKNRLSVFTTKQGLANDKVWNITKDKYGNLWFGTDGGGLSRYNGNSISTFTSKQNLLGNRITNIEEDISGTLWFGSYQGGVSRYDGKSFINYTTSQGLPGYIIDGIKQDRTGNIWICTNKGISRFDGLSFTTYTKKQGLVNEGGNSIMEDKNGILWFCTPEGVSRYDGKGFTNFTILQGLSNNNITTVTEGPDGDLWFGTEGGGVCRYDGKSFRIYTTNQGLAQNTIKCILKDKSRNLWFGTAGGVSRFDGTRFISFNTTQGLADDLVAGIVEDENGVIWFGTDKGLCGLKFNTTVPGKKQGEIRGAGLLKENNEELELYEPVWEIYNDKTGYPVKDLYERAMYITKSGLKDRNKEDVGVIWIGCSDETLIRFDPRSVIKSNEKPVVYLKAIKINETPLNWYSLHSKSQDSTTTRQQEAMVYGNLLPAKVRDSLQKKFRDIRFDSITPFYQVPLNLVLPFRHNRVTIDFGAIETNRNFMVRYQYMLEGYDNDWSPVTEKSSAIFGNISEGTYTFKLKARSAQGVWSDSISYRFKVLPPWWRSWWFRTLMGIALLFLLYGIYRWRTAALHQQKRVLEQTVKVRTAEVEKRNIVIQKEKEKSDELLLNILPSEVAEELKEKGHTTAKSYDEVTVLFSDIKGFTNVAEKMTAQELVKEIDTYFSAFDGIMQQYGLEKIKTIGDAYIAAGGLPEKNAASPQNVVEAAIAMQQEVEKLKQERILSDKPYFELRIGIHTGPVVAGVVGIKKFQYDIWGDTVNLAARMEQSGVAGKINISQHAYELVKEHFTCIHRGKINAKNKGEVDMYFVEGK